MRVASALAIALLVGCGSSSDSDDAVTSPADATSVGDAGPGPPDAPDLQDAAEVEAGYGGEAETVGDAPAETPETTHELSIRMPLKPRSPSRTALSSNSLRTQGLTSRGLPTSRQAPTRPSALRASWTPAM